MKVKIEFRISKTNLDKALKVTSAKQLKKDLIDDMNWIFAHYNSNGASIPPGISNLKLEVSE